MKRVSQVLAVALLVSAVFCLVSVGVFFIRLTLNTNKLMAQATVTLKAIQKDVTDIKEMTNATLYQIGDVSAEAANMIRLEKVYVQQESQQLVKTNETLNATLVQLQTSIKNVDSQAQNALEPLPKLLNQTRYTLLEAQKTTADLGQTTVKVGETVDKLKPVVDHLNDTAIHMSSTSASLDTFVKDAVKPKPWYKRVIGYVYAPLKVASVFIK